jgi:hypothetical protein
LSVETGAMAASEQPKYLLSTRESQEDSNRAMEAIGKQRMLGAEASVDRQRDGALNFDVDEAESLMGE